MQNAINRIRTFPTDIERPRVVMRSFEKQTISLILYGDSDRLTLYNLAISFKQRLLQHPEISKVGIYGVSTLQYSIEIDKETLRKYNLSLEEIARRINSDSLDLPVGSIKTSSQEILVRLNQRKELIEKFKNIPISFMGAFFLFPTLDVSINYANIFHSGNDRENISDHPYCCHYNLSGIVGRVTLNPSITLSTHKR